MSIFETLGQKLEVLLSSFCGFTHPTPTQTPILDLSPIMPYPLINIKTFAPPPPLFSITQYFKDSIPYNLQLEGFKLCQASRNYVTLDKVNWTSRNCVALKKIWSYCTLTNIKFR